MLTGDTLAAGELEKYGIFTEIVADDQVESRADWWARKIARMPADGIVIAKEAFRLVEQVQAYQGEEAASYIFHAFGTNLQFDEDEFNFVKARSEHGTKRAFELRDAHFHVPEPYDADSGLVLHGVLAVLIVQSGSVVSSTRAATGQVPRSVVAPGAVRP